MKKLYSSSRYQDRVKRPHLKREFKKISDLDLYSGIKSDILYYVRTQRGCYLHFTAESYANMFKVPIHKVRQVFDKLKHEGLLTRKHNRKTDHKWNASFYYVREANVDRFI